MESMSMDDLKQRPLWFLWMYKAKAASGKPLTTNPPYGYLKDLEDKSHWVVDEDAADVVKEAFHLCVQGYAPTQIARKFMEQGYRNPTAHMKSIGISTPDNRIRADDYQWDTSTVVHILERLEYLGHTVNGRTYRKSYKNKKMLKRDRSEWQIFENTHEPIIDKETFDIVQRIWDGRRRNTPQGEMPLLSGMVYCADCGAKMYQVRCKRFTHEQEYLVCATYRKLGKTNCPFHQIRNVVIEELLLKSIQDILAFARRDEDKFVTMVTQKSQAALNRSQRDGKRELEQAHQRIAKLDTIIQRLYEDNIEGKISDERFAKMSENYEMEQAQLKSRVSELEVQLRSEKDDAMNMNQFLGLVKKYTEVQELTAEIIREFVERIYVYKAEKVDGHRVQRIKVVWNYIGELPSSDQQA